jgi:alkanesulfonate monooxygenase SsuD/methylene tetrahydromethanopterin reductase-like flavin-dependent oxidoreductase (luciferase family)
MGISMPCLNTKVSQFPDLAEWADEAGFDSVWSCEFYKNPLNLLSLSSRTTSRIALGTAIVQAGPARRSRWRTPPPTSTSCRMGA